MSVVIGKNFLEIVSSSKTVVTGSTNVTDSCLILVGSRKSVKETSDMRVLRPSSEMKISDVLLDMISVKDDRALDGEVSTELVRKIKSVKVEVGREVTIIDVSTTTTDEAFTIADVNSRVEPVV